ncbi:hypothetical protein CYY_006204, partial [Polysphondylium violaceum]
MLNKLLSVLICLLFISTIQSASIVDIIAPPEDNYGSVNGCGQKMYQIIVNSAVPVNIDSVNGVAYSSKSLVNGTITIFDVAINFPNLGLNDPSITLIDDAGNTQIFPSAITYYCMTVPTYTLATNGGWSAVVGNGFHVWYKFISLNGLSKPTNYDALTCSVQAPFMCQIMQYPTILTSYYFLISMYMTNENVAYSLPINIEIANSYGTNKLIFPFNEIPAGPSTISNIQIYPANNTVVTTDIMSDAHFFFDAPNLNVLPSIGGGFYYKVNINIPMLGNPTNASYFAFQPAPYSPNPIPFSLEALTKTGVTKLTPDHFIKFENPYAPYIENVDPTSTSSDITELPGSKVFSLKSKSTRYNAFITGAGNYSNFAIKVGYPYGITNGNLKDFYHACSILADSYSSGTFSINCGGYYFDGLQNPLATVDDANPSLSNVEIFGLDAEKVLIRVYANDDISGVQTITYMGGTAIETMTNRDIVKGTKMNGVYEYISTYYSYSQKSPIFTAYDVKSNKLKFESNRAIINTVTKQRVPRFPIYDLIESSNLQSFNFTFFQFKYNDVDLSTNGVNNTLYFNITNAHPSMIPRLYVIPSLMDAFEPSVSAANSFIEGMWNATSKLYQVDFYLPPRVFTGKVIYSIAMSPNVWDSNMLESVFGAQSQLRVSSSNGDLMPPVVSAYAAYPSTAVNVVADTQIGWTITIQDLVNGLKSAAFNITSDYDLEPFTIKVTPANAVSGDKYTGVYNIRIPVSVNCRSQSFRISSIVMTDTSDHSSFYPSARQMNSLYKFIHSDQHFVNVT